MAVVARSVALFVAAAVAEIGGAYLVWQAVREHRGMWLAVLGGAGLVLYGVIATFQPDNNFGRVLAAYGGVFVAGSLAWGRFSGLTRVVRGGRWTPGGRRGPKPLRSGPSEGLD